MSGFRHEVWFADCSYLNYSFPAFCMCTSDAWCCEDYLFASFSSILSFINFLSENLHVSAMRHWQLYYKSRVLNSTSNTIGSMPSHCWKSQRACGSPREAALRWIPVTLNSTPSPGSSVSFWRTVPAPWGSAQSSFSHSKAFNSQPASSWLKLNFLSWVAEVHLLKPLPRTWQ